MKVYTPYGILIFALTVSSCLTPQLGDTPPSEEDYQRVSEAEEKVSSGPAYKNPNAAGRLLLFNRTTPKGPDEPTERLMGPAYKNRKPTFAASDTIVPTRAARPRLTGPRYKNRLSKSGGQR